MKIKSTLSRPFLGFESFTLGSLMFAILYGMAFSILIVAWDLAAFLKIVMLAGTMIVMMIVMSGIKDPLVKAKEIRKGMLALVLAVLVCEVTLYHKSTYEETVDITVVANEFTGSDEKPYVSVEYYNNVTNKRMKTFNVVQKNQDMINFYKDVDSMRTYIEYTPFVTFSKEVEYTREKKE